ncbi:MAG: lamin tail domain-containing protein, partial [Verrucomicrobiae bacterium]|nr:lamin tail domain-containing protein [Verrucomicrobiae bacterium]
YALFAGTPTPGAPNYKLSWDGPVFNEVLARSDTVVPGGPDPASDWVEIFNPTDQAYDLAGFSVSTGPAEPGEWIFPTGATVPSGGHLLLLCDGSQPASLEWSDRPNIGRSLSAEGDALHLFDPAGRKVDSVEFGFQVRDQSIGRSLGTWTLLATPSPGDANSAAAPTSAYTWLRLNEWQANGPGDDWIEIVNPVDRPINLSGLRLTDDPSYAGLDRYLIPGLSFIAPGDFVVWQADGKPAAGPDHLPFSLDPLGETLRLSTSTGLIIDQQVLSAQPAAGSQGRFPDAGTEVVDFPQTASPGAPNYLPHPSVVINEVLARADPPLENAVELANPGELPVDLGGWWFSDDEHQLRKFRVPPGTVLPPGGYAVLFEDQFANPALADQPFSLVADDAVRLFLSETDAEDNLTGRRATATFGPAENGVSLGRHST